ncbi:MAG: fused MFS/spermidine synthase, partial [Bdellovibrionales bacterium]
MPRPLFIICGLFFLSGFPALVYQLLWQRALFHIFGVNIESVTIVVTAFMIGLGLGSLAGGFISKRRDIPLLPLLAIIECLIGAFGFFSLDIFHEVGGYVLGLSLTATAAVSLALVIVPTVLMGATLPILVAHLARRSRNVGDSLGLLYYVNTLGAGISCLVAAFFLFPFLGMRGSLHVAVLMNMTVAAGAMIAWLFGKKREIKDTAPGDRKTDKPVFSFPAVLALAFIGGYIALSYEIFFFRVVSYASGGIASYFAQSLGIFLIGMAVGSRYAGKCCASRSPQKVAKCILTGLILANMVGLLYLPLLNGAVQAGIDGFGPAFLMIFLFIAGWSVLLPGLAFFGIAADSSAGMRTALMYLANILGAAAGGIITGFELMDRFGLVDLAILLVIAGLACLAALVFMLPLNRGLRAKPVAVAAVLALGAFMLPLTTSSLLSNLQWKFPPEKPPFVQAVENRSGIIAVDQGGIVYGNGIYDGMFNTDLLHHDTNGIIRPFALSLFHAAPRDVLMIGLSSGSWAQVIVNNPEVDSVTAVEINPGYLSLIAGRPEVSSLLANPKFTVVIDDGRRWLRRHPERRFDAIIMNTSHYFRAHASSLLSAEFLELVKSHLKPGGIVFYNATDSRRVMRTACQVFPYGARFTNHMLVSNAPLDWDYARWRRKLEPYQIDDVPVV